MILLYIIALVIVISGSPNVSTHNTCFRDSQSCCSCPVDNTDFLDVGILSDTMRL